MLVNGTTNFSVLTLALTPIPSAPDVPTALGSTLAMIRWARAQAVPLSRRGLAPSVPRGPRNRPMTTQVAVAVMAVAPVAVDVTAVVVFMMMARDVGANAILLMMCPLLVQVAL